MKTLSLKLPDELDARINAAAKRKQSNKSQVVRNALEAYLANETTPHKGSALDLAGNLVGALEGPSDLSHREEYMNEYGQ